MQKQPLLIMLLCFATGIALFEKFHFEPATVYLLLGTSTVMLPLIFIRNFWIQKYKPVVLGLFFAAVGIFSHFINSKTPQLPNFDGKQKVIFKLNKKLNSNEEYRRYEVSVLKTENQNPATLPLNTVVSVPKESPQLDFKNYYQSELYLNRIQPPNNNFQFDYAKYSSRQNVYYQGFATNEVLAIAIKDVTFPDKFRQNRLEVLQNIDSSKLSAKTKEFLKGIILADRTEMDAETVSDFSRSGLVHFLAISGSHMAVIFWLVMLIFNRITPPKFRIFSIIISLILIWFFGAFIGFGSSVLRSCIMVTAYYFYIILGRKPDLLHAIALAGFTILIFDTNQLFDVGFQLSFLAVLGIFWLNRPILKLLGNPSGWWPRFFAGIISMSLSAQIATLPLVLYYFHQYSLVAIVANFAIIPFSEIIIIFSLLMTVLISFKIEFGWLDLIYDFLTSSLLKAIHWFAIMDFAYFKNIPMTVFEVGILLVAIYLLRNVLIKKNHSAVLKFSFAVLFFISVRIGLNFYQFNNDETITTNYFKNKVLLVKQRGKLTVFADTKIKPEKLQKYILDPYLSRNRIADYEIKSLPDNAEKAVVNGQNFNLK